MKVGGAIPLPAAAPVLAAGAPHHRTTTHLRPLRSLAGLGRPRGPMEGTTCKRWIPQWQAQIGGKRRQWKPPADPAASCVRGSDLLAARYCRWPGISPQQGLPHDLSAPAGGPCPRDTILLAGRFGSQNSGCLRLWASGLGPAA